LSGVWSQATVLVQRIFDGIIETLVTAGRNELRNFGVFEEEAQAEEGTTGDTVKVPAKPVVTFKAGREMRLRVGQLKKVPGRDGEAVGNHSR